MLGNDTLKVKLNNIISAILLLNPAVKGLWKSGKIWESYEEILSGMLF